MWLMPHRLKWMNYCLSSSQFPCSRTSRAKECPESQLSPLPSITTPDRQPIIGCLLPTTPLPLLFGLEMPSNMARLRPTKNSSPKTS